MTLFDELARLGAATVYEASGRRGLIDADLIQLVPGSRACGPARTVRCGQGDNLMVHAAMARTEPGELREQVAHSAGRTCGSTRWKASA